MSYNKLVRDNIPDIIRSSGALPIFSVLNPKEYRKELHKKLQEETAEFLASKDVEELADIIEVCIAIAEDKGLTEGELFKIRTTKRLTRGAFKHKIYLESVEPAEPERHDTDSD